MNLFLFLLITIGALLVGWTGRALWNGFGAMDFENALAPLATMPFWIAYLILWIIYLSIS